MTTVLARIPRKVESLGAVGIGHPDSAVANCADDSTVSWLNSARVPKQASALLVLIASLTSATTVLVGYPTCLVMSCIPHLQDLTFLATSRVQNEEIFSRPATVSFHQLPDLRFAVTRRADVSACPTNGPIALFGYVVNLTYY